MGQWIKLATCGSGMSCHFSSLRGRRGGGWTSPSPTWPAPFRNGDFPTSESTNKGFRVATVPEPTVVCDFSGDGACDVTDVDLMQALGPISGSGVPATGNEQFDLNADGMIDLTDRDQWLAIAATENGFASPYKLGDANIDGIVDGQDFIAWNASKFTSDLLWSHGDSTADGLVDGQDFIAWNANKFTSSDAVSAVPEPTPWMLLFALVLGVVRSRR